MISTVEEPEVEVPKPELEEPEVKLSLERTLVEDVVTFKAAHPIWPLAKAYKKPSELTRKTVTNGEADCA